MNYQTAIKYLQSFIDYEKLAAYAYKESLKLERVKGFLGVIGNPQSHLCCIHVAGTKGKGSTCAFVAYILREAGFKVGLYTSPHLSDFRERIRIISPRFMPACRQGRAHGSRPGKDFEGMIPKKDLVRILSKLKPKIGKYNKESEYGPLTFFEVYTALAFVYFKDKKTDFAVLETGLGGRLDATNAAKPLVCAITPISYEHTQKLGNTLRKIAGEKAGIIKTSSRCSAVHGSPSVVISAPQQKEAGSVIRKKCRDKHAILFEVGKDIKYKKRGSLFSVQGISTTYAGLKTHLLGEHQLINAATAIGIVESLRFYNINIGKLAIKNGIANTVWPGRCEVVSTKPVIVLDGAQNIASASVITKAIKENFKYNKLILVLGISSDKDIAGICRKFYDFADTIILTQADNSRAGPVENLAVYFKDKDVYLTQQVKQALKLAKDKAKPSDLILVTGSLFVVGEARCL